MTRNHEPRVSGHALLKERKVDNNEIEFAEKGLRTLYAHWKQLDDRLIKLSGEKTFMLPLGEFCQQLQSFVEDFTTLLEEKPKLKGMRRRPKYSELELQAQRKRTMQNPNKRLRESLLAKMGEAYFVNPSVGYEGNY